VKDARVIRPVDGTTVADMYEVPEPKQFPNGIDQVVVCGVQEVALIQEVGATVCVDACGCNPDKTTNGLVAATRRLFSATTLAKEATQPNIATKRTKRERDIFFKKIK